MLDQPTVRRREDGSIDIDFHRQAGLTERRRVMTEFFHGMKKLHRGAIAVLLLAAALYMAPRDVAGGNAVSATSAQHNGVIVNPLSSSAQFVGAGTASPTRM